MSAKSRELDADQVTLDLEDPVAAADKPNAIAAGINEGGYSCYFYDPDDIALELLQPPAHRLAGA